MKCNAYMMIPDLCFFPIYLPVRYAMRIWSSIPFGHFTKYHVVHICNISPNKDICRGIFRISTAGWRNAPAYFLVRENSGKY